MHAVAESRRRVHPRRGAAVVEFAIIFPLLMLLVLGCVDFGRFAYHYIAVSNAARAGAGYGSMNTYNPASPSTVAAWQTNTKQAAADELTGQTGFDATELGISLTTIDEGSGDLRIQVTATYPFRTLIPWPGIPSSVSLQRTVAMRKIR